MKICPRCQTTYADDNLNFCLEDGSTLTLLRRFGVDLVQGYHLDRPIADHPALQEKD